MGKRDSQYTISGVLELDEVFFSTEVKEAERDQSLKRERGSQKKSKIIVMIESDPVQEKSNTENTREKSRKMGHLKMKVIENLKEETITASVQSSVSDQATIDSDNSTSYTTLKDVVKEHKLKVIPKKETGKALPFVHIAISNAKRLLLNRANARNFSFAT